MSLPATSIELRNFPSGDIIRGVCRCVLEINSQVALERRGGKNYRKYRPIDNESRLFENGGA